MIQNWTITVGSEQGIDGETGELSYPVEMQVLHENVLFEAYSNSTAVMRGKWNTKVFKFNYFIEN